MSKYNLTEEEILQWRARRVFSIRNERAKINEIKKAKQIKLDSVSKLSFDSNVGKEVLVKITSNVKTFEGLQKHIDYISRNGKLEILDSDMMIFKGKEELKDCLDGFQNIGKPLEKERELLKLKRETYNIVLSMKDFKDCPPEKLKSAVYKTIKTFYPNNYFALALHTDTDNPHCHVCLKISNAHYKRVNIQKADLFALRQQFAQNLNDLGIEAYATKSRQRHLSLDLSKIEPRTSSIKPHYYQVVDFGEAPYKNDSKNKSSYFVSYITPKGITKIWGNDLKRVVEESQLQKGEYARFAKVGDRLQNQVIEKRFKNKLYQVQSEKKVAVWDVSILHRAEKQFVKRPSLKTTYTMREKQVQPEYAGNEKHLQQIQGENNAGKQRYTKQQWARFYANKRAREKSDNGIHKSNTPITRNYPKPINDLPTLSQIDMVSNSKDTQMFLSDNAQHKLRAGADSRSDFTL